MRLINADELERRIREAEKIFYDTEDVGIVIDCINVTKTISEWHFPSKGDLPETDDRVLCCTQTKSGMKNIVIGYYMDGLWRCGMNSNVIAWQPLPEPPKEEA